MFYLSFCSAFEHPHPPLRLVLDSVSEMVFHIQRSLAAATITMNQLCLDMNTDVFRFLFNGKGIDAGKAYKEYKLSDFDKKYFLGEWYVNFDENGDGCAIDFPLKMKSCIRWRGSQSTRAQRKTVFFERIYILACMCLYLIHQIV